MRIADRTTFDNTGLNLQKNRSDMAELQNQAATQKRINRPSDDPLATARVLATRTELGTAQQFIKSINNARAFLEYSDQSLGELGEVLMRAKELAINQSNDASASEHTRSVVATEVEQLHKQTVQIGNRKLGDRFLFGGFKTNRPPFEPDGKYLGDNGEMEVIVNKEAKIAMNVPGSVVFLGVDPKAPVQSPEPKQSFDERAPLNAPKPTKEDEMRAEIRGPAGQVSFPPPAEGEEPYERPANLSETWSSEGIDVFKVLKNLETSMRTNDKEGIQDSLNDLDTALAQVVMARSQLGSRAGTLTSSIESLEKSKYDSKVLASSLEDVDAFELVNNLNKSENTLKASLATSSKLLQPSLLDFLR